MGEIKLGVAGKLRVFRVLDASREVSAGGTPDPPGGGVGLLQKLRKLQVPEEPYWIF